MLDFFEQQLRTRRNTIKLLILFGLALVLITVAIYFTVLGLLILDVDSGLRSESHRLWRPALFGWVALATTVLVSAASLYKHRQLPNGIALCLQVGGLPLPLRPKTPSEQRLRHVVEEMAIASGCPIPTIFVLRSESGINAFAAGYTPDDAVIAVSQGALDQLDRDELQGVIAHEFSHILYGDMRLNLQLIGVLHGILVIGLTGRMLLRSLGNTRRKGRSSRPNSDGTIVLLGVALTVIGYLGLVLGRLIKAAISRQREFLADASAVEFTRNPRGIAGALKKIGALPAGSFLLHAHAEQASHMLFASTMAKGFFERRSMYDTHPPLEKRIRRLEPQWDGRYPEIKPLRADRERLVSLAEAALRRNDHAALAALTAFGATDKARRHPLDAERLSRRVALVSPEHVAYGRELLDRLPAPITEAAHESLGAQALVVALLLSDDSETEDRQLAHLERADPRPEREARERTLGQALLPLVKRLRPLVEELGEPGRLPVLDLTIPTLKSLSIRDYQRFAALLDELAVLEPEPDLFTFVLRKALLVHLRRAFVPERRTPTRYYSLRALDRDIAALLSVLAWFGNDDRDHARKAFEAGLERLRLRRTDAELRLLERHEARLDLLDGALERLRSATLGIKRRVLDAAAWAAAQDGRITVREAEALRAIGDTLGLPLPPFLDRTNNDDSPVRRGAQASLDRAQSSNAANRA